MVEFLLIIRTISFSILLFTILPNKTQTLTYIKRIITINVLRLTTLLYLKTRNKKIEINILANNTNNNIILNATIDYLSSLLLLLSTILLISCLLIRKTTIYHANKVLFLCLLATILILTIAFTTTHMLLFYILFESSIIPLIIIIRLWGSRKEKIRARYYFLLYTIIGSLPLLLTILTINNKNGTFFIFLIQKTTEKTTRHTIQFIGLFLAFAIKTPLLPWHTWLPLAHVEAPTIGSILLAGILLKLGAYGFIRFTLPLLPITSKFLSPLIIRIRICRLWLASLNSLRQNDIKRIIAYSSIAHMRIITAAIFSQNNIRKNGAILLMISHGLTRPILFILTSLLYERHKTRLLKRFKGTRQLTPILTTLFLITRLAHMSTPGSINFIGEFICLLGLWELHPLTMLLRIPGVLITTAYLLLLYIHIRRGKTHIYSFYKLYDTKKNELYAILSLITPNILLGTIPFPLISI